MDEQAKEKEAFQNSTMEKVATLQEQVEEMRGDYVMWKRIMANGDMAVSQAPKVRTPEPKTYNGSRDARELDNWLWQLERYFEATKLKDEEAKIRTATMYLTDTATLWWRRRHADMARGTCTINTWEDFKKEIKKQFYPENVEYLARKNLKRLKHTGSIRDYVKEFSTLMLEVPDMPEKEFFFNFMAKLGRARAGTSWGARPRIGNSGSREADRVLEDRLLQVQVYQECPRQRWGREGQGPQW